MMPMRKGHERLLDRLPKLRGRYTENAPLAGITWFRVGGTADVMFRPADPDDLAEFLAAKPDDVPVTVIGVGSNLLVRDGGIRGVVLRLGRGFADIATNDLTVRTGAAALDLNVALVARDAGIGGLEFLSGIPGTIGGAVRMNGGAYGREMKDVTLRVVALDGRGERQELTNLALGFGYRHCSAPADWIFISAELKGEPASPNDIQTRIAAINSAREESQPLRTRTGGSTFANPNDPKAQGRKAWELIDAVGGRGLTIGGAMVSEKHCNFLINTGSATAADIEALGEELRRRVREKFGVSLEWEIRIVGDKPAEGATV
jgi:UDP-N-acetylmuramate dehydrogenase